MSDLTKADLREDLGNIDKIRDVLFGSQLREYSDRLEQMEREVASSQQEFRNRLDELRQSLMGEFQTTIDAIDKRIRALALKDEEEKFDIRQQIESLNKRIASTAEDLQESMAGDLDDLADDTDKRLKQLQTKDSEEKFEIRQQLDLLSKRMNGNIEALDENLDKQTTTLQTSLVETREKLQQDILDLRTQIFEELERYCSMLSEVKVSKDDMAELLFELGLRLKGSEFVPELREAANRDPADLRNITQESPTIAESLPEAPEEEEAVDSESEEVEEAEVEEPKTSTTRKSATTTRKSRASRLKPS